MKQYSAMFLASLLVVAACDSKSEGNKDDKTQAANGKDAKKADDKKAEPKKEEAKPAAEGAVAVKSGIAVGGKMEAFDIINCESDKLYCQVCKFGSSPKIMAAGSPSDPQFKEDLKTIQALVAKMGKNDKGEDKLKAFALIGEKKGDVFLPPTKEELDAAKKAAKAIKEELKLDMPVVVAADLDEDGNKNSTFTKHYNITESGTVMFADGKNEVKYSKIGKDNDMAELEKLVQSTVG